MEIVALILTITGLFFAFSKPRSLFIGLIHNLFPKLPTIPKAELRLSVTKFERGLDFYNPNIRVYNPHNSGDTIILSKLFLELHEVNEHSKTISGKYYGAPIQKIKRKGKPLRITANLGKYLIINQERKFPPNEVEDFEFKFVMEEGKKYLLRFGATSYIIGDAKMTQSFISNWYRVGYPNLSYEDQDEYIPKITFLDEPELIEGTVN